MGDDEVELADVTDVCDVGEGVPLLLAGFRKDVDDAERGGVHQSHLNFYYGKYFRKTIVPKAYGKETLEDVIAFVKDTIVIDSDSGVLACKFPADSEKAASDFIKLQEQNRRERQRRIDAGDE